MKNGEMSWIPAVDANRSILLGCLTGIISLWCCGASSGRS